MNEMGEFTPPHPLSTPVLFLVFNRLDTTKQVFKAIRQAKPPRLYLASDGQRADRPGENEKVQSVRDYVMSSIDWNCGVASSVELRLPLVVYRLVETVIGLRKSYIDNNLEQKA
jgi:hypothetical protein